MDIVAYQETFGQTCPRVDLDQDNAEASELLNFLADERLRPLAAALLESLCGHLTSEERLEIMRRAEAALCHPDVVAIMYPKPADAE